MQDQTVPQTREIKARYLTAGMAVVAKNVHEPLTVMSALRGPDDTVRVRFRYVASERYYGVEDGVTIVDADKESETDATTYRVTFHDVEVDPLTIPGNTDGTPRRVERLTAEIRRHLADSGYTADVTVHPASGTATVRDEDDNYDLGEITISGPGIGPEPEPDLSQLLAAELHRIADAITERNLPVGDYSSLRFGVVDSRADLDRWADYLGTTLDVPDGTGIPSVTTRIRLGNGRYGPELSIGVQSRKDEASELERLRARNAELEAQIAAGGAK